MASARHSIQPLNVNTFVCNVRQVISTTGECVNVLCDSLGAHTKRPPRVLHVATLFGGQLCKWLNSGGRCWCMYFILLQTGLIQNSYPCSLSCELLGRVWKWNKRMLPWATSSVLGSQSPDEILHEGAWYLHRVLVRYEQLQRLPVWMQFLLHVPNLPYRCLRQNRSVCISNICRDLLV